MVFLCEISLKLLLDTKIVNFLKNFCFELNERYYFEYNTIGSYRDHVNLFGGAESKYAPSKLIQIINRRPLER